MDSGLIVSCIMCQLQLKEHQGSPRLKNQGEIELEVLQIGGAAAAHLKFLISKFLMMLFYCRLRQSFFVCTELYVTCACKASCKSCLAVPSHRSAFSCSCSCLSLAIMSVAGRSCQTNKAPSQAPCPPPDYTFPPNFRPKRCVRCGAWSTQQAPYEQGNSPEKAWGILIAWEAGTVLNPQGRHCLLCRKARLNFNFDH